VGKEKVRLGRIGEEIALDFLRKNGYRIIERNFRSLPGEIDLIAEEGKVKVFVEVKTRNSLAHGLPGDAITSRKKRHMVKAALSYIKKRGWTAQTYRFDIVGIIMNGKGKVRNIEIIRNAFQPDTQYG